MRRQFYNGDIVRLVPQFSKCMSHFDGAGGLAVVQYNYKERYGGTEKDNHTYGLFLLTEAGVPLYSCSWFNDSDIDYIVLPADIETIQNLENL